MSLMNEGGGLPAVMNVEPAGSNNNGNNGGWGGDWSAWIVIFILFACFGGWGGMGGFGGFGGMGGGYPVESILQRSLDTQTIIGKLDGVNQGICDSTFALQNSLNGLGTTVMQGFNNVGSAICNSEYQNAQLINGVNTNMMQGFNSANVVALQNQNALQSQLAQCCCDNRVGQMQIQNQMASDTCAVQNAIQSTTRDTLDNANANARAILDALTAQRIEAKDERIAAQAAQIQALQLAASQDRQNALLTSAMANQTNQIIGALQPPAPIPAYQVPNPLTGGCGVPTCGTC